MPERLRVVGTQDFERRLLDAAACEQPPPALSQRMAVGIGVSAAVLGAAHSTTALATGAAAPKAAAGSSGLLAWVSGAVVAVAVGGAIVATRPGTTSAPQARRPSPALSAARPAAPAATAPASVVPVSAAEASPRVTVPIPAQVNRAGLRGQIALLDAARAAVSAGEGGRALEILGQYERKYPAGSFHPEATALRIEALTKVGRNAEARALAQRFVAAHGAGPLSDRVARVAGLPAPKAGSQR
jgi:hypothetical protein